MRGARCAAGAQDDDVDLGGRAVVELDTRHDLAARRSGGGAGHLTVQAHVDAVRFQRLLGQFADPGFLAGHQPAPALDESDLRSHTGQELSGLHGDGAATDHQHSAGDVYKVGGFPVGPDRDVGVSFGAGGVGTHGLGAGGQDDVLGGQLPPTGVHLEESLACASDDPTGGLDDRSALVGVPLHLVEVIELRIM